MSRTRLLSARRLDRRTDADRILVNLMGQKRQNDLR